MSMFDMSVAQGVKEGGKFLQAGIHNATFMGITSEEVTSQKDNKTYNVLNMIFDVEGFGEMKHKLFEPKSATRTESQFGTNPSDMEQFMIANYHLLATANPDIAKGIDEGTVKIDAPNFVAFVKKMQEFTNDFIGKSVKVKLLPTKSGFNQMPSFPAKISKTGKLYLTTSFIGNELTLTAYELAAIEKAKNAKPTNMAAMKSSDDILEGMSEDINSTDEDGDLPF